MRVVVDRFVRYRVSGHCTNFALLMVLVIHCPFDEKEQAKALGARWNPREKHWYAPTQETYDKLNKWHKPRTVLNTPRKAISKFDRNPVMSVKSMPRNPYSRTCFGSYYKGVWGGEPPLEQLVRIKGGENIPSTAWDTRGD